MMVLRRSVDEHARPLLVLILALGSLMTSGCYKTTFVNDALVPTNEEDSQRKAYFLWGMVGDGEVDVRQICKHDAHTITWEADFLDVFVGAITLGIVGLRSVTVECGAPPGSTPSSPAPAAASLSGGAR